MPVKPILLSELRRAPTPAQLHQKSTGQGNYNRFNLLQGRPRSDSNASSLAIPTKRRFEGEDIPQSPKIPRLDANKVFEQLKAQDTVLAEAKALMAKVSDQVNENFSAQDGGIGTAISGMVKVMDLLVKSQENLTSALIDTCKVSENPTFALPTKTANIPPRKDKQVADPQTKEAAQRNKVKQVLKEAEKRTLCFNLDLGTVPTMNKQTLAKKVTLALHEKAQAGDHDYNTGDAEELLDDMLSCANLEFLGTGTRKFHNKRDDKDKRNGNMCTMPVRLDFKSKEIRIQAEDTLRKICKVSCATPYPRKLRSLLDEVLKEGKKAYSKCYIRTKVNYENLTIEAHARTENGWVDLKLKRDIPLDILDRFDTSTGTPAADNVLMETGEVTHTL